MEIRKLEDKDIAEVVNLWYNTIVIAHNFIASDYWKDNKDAMSNVYLPNSESYLAIINDEMVGFISMVENYLAAIFVQTNMQGKGIGKKLLNYVKDKRDAIHLKVYKKNSNSVQFYLSQGFNMLSERMDKDTNEFIVSMEWNK